MKTVALSDVKDNFSSYVKDASTEDVVITIRGKAVAVIHGFEDEDEYLEYKLLNDPKFKERIAESRRQVKEGKVTRLDDLDD